MSSNGLRLMFGTWQSSAGYPIGIKNCNFSFEGRSNSSRSRDPQFIGVVINEHKPLTCI